MPALTNRIPSVEIRTVGTRKLEEGETSFVLEIVHLSSLHAGAWEIHRPTVVTPFEENRDNVTTLATDKV